MKNLFKKIISLFVSVCIVSSISSMVFANSEWYYDEDFSQSPSSSWEFAYSSGVSRFYEGKLEIERSADSTGGTANATYNFPAAVGDGVLVVEFRIVLGGNTTKNMQVAIRDSANKALALYRFNVNNKIYVRVTSGYSELSSTQFPAGTEIHFKSVIDFNGGNEAVRTYIDGVESNLKCPIYESTLKQASKVYFNLPLNDSNGVTVKVDDFKIYKAGTEFEKVANASAAIDLSHFSSGIAVDNIDLPTGDENVNIAWTSSDESVISSSGAVTRSTIEDKTVTLTANISSKISPDVVTKREFVLLVKKLVPLSKGPDWYFETFADDFIASDWTLNYGGGFVGVDESSETLSILRTSDGSQANAYFIIPTQFKNLDKIAIEYRFALQSNIESPEFQVSLVDSQFSNTAFYRYFAKINGVFSVRNTGGESGSTLIGKALEKDKFYHVKTIIDKTVNPPTVLTYFDGNKVPVVKTFLDTIDSSTFERIYFNFPDAAANNGGKVAIDDVKVYVPGTPAQQMADFTSSFVLKDTNNYPLSVSNITKNLTLPTYIDEIGSIEWESDSPAVQPDGTVTRSTEKEQKFTLVGTVKSEGIKDEIKIYGVVPADKGELNYLDFMLTDENYNATSILGNEDLYLSLRLRNDTNQEEEGIIVTAFYDNSMLLDVKMTEYNAAAKDSDYFKQLKISKEEFGDASAVRCFIIKDYQTLKPIVNVVGAQAQ